MTDYTDTILTPDVREILQSEYERSNIQSIFKNILIPDFEYRSNSISHQCNLLGEFTEIGASKHLELAVYEINLVPHAYKKRIFITQQVFKILREFKRDNSIVIFNTGDGKYRLSLFTSKWEYNPITSKVSNTPSNQRRFSFPLGIGTKIKTPYEFLIKKGKINDVNELLERFSLQLLNKQFYEEMQRVFTQLTGGEFLGVKHKVLLKLKYRDPPSIDSPNVVTHMRLAIKLISRIIVCKFLCEMKSENGLPLMNEELLSEDAVIESKGNYYYDVLMPLFFEVLNRSQEDRLDSIKTDPRYTNIPCLSGGLFSPQVDDGYANSERGAVSDVDVFIPNSWLATFFGILNEYNFIPDENTPYDSEISIDPEMLGQIFENLLATIDPDTDESARKSTGSFYTPREIVDYMVSASICEYLKSKTGIKEYLLRNLISYESANETLFKLSIDDVSNIVSA
ncbi:MAG: hypothetical protein LBE09_09050, partial [Christensenellaceae bacterium]|nr:hypothetical protein [Christensenellaceae bacterium]